MKRKEGEKSAELLAKLKSQEARVRRKGLPPEPLGKAWPTQVIGGKYVRILEKELTKLRDAESHGNQRLFLDDVFIVYLLAFFNPTVRSLRTIEDFTQSRQIQKHISIRKICKSTLSDFNQLVEPARLTPIISALRTQLNETQGKVAQPTELQALLNNAIAVDGTFVPAVAEVSWAIATANKSSIKKKHRARLDVQLNVSTWLPEAIVVPDDGQSEADSAIKHLQAGKLYIYDRGFINFGLVGAHFEQANDEFIAKSHFVMRFKVVGKNASSLEKVVERTLTEGDRAAGVVSDRVGYFITKNAERAGISKILLREVVISFQENGETKSLRLITNLMNVSANNVGQIYKYRWQVELFFRWLKCFGNFGHLISNSREGVLAHFYVTIIGVMLMYLHTGFRPSKYLFALLSQVATGAASLEEIIPILRERERQSALARLSAARRAAKKKS